MSKFLDSTLCILILTSNLNFQHLSYFFASRLVLIFACGFDCCVLVLILLKKNLHELPIQSRWLGRLQRKIKLIWFWGIWMDVCPATYFCCHILGQSKPNKVKWKQRDWSRIKMRNIGKNTISLNRSLPNCQTKYN